VYFLWHGYFLGVTELMMEGAICSRNDNVDYTCQPLDYIFNQKAKRYLLPFFVGGFIDVNGSL
jgi:hypothetical protein